MPSPPNKSSTNVAIGDNNSRGISSLAWTASGILGFGAVVGTAAAVSAVSVYKKVPPNKLLVVYGRGVAGLGDGVRIVKGGGTMIVPFLQQAQYMSLEPMTMEIPLKGALSLEKIRVNVPSVFTIAISAEEGASRNAAMRLLHMDRSAISLQAEEVVIGQMRQVLAGLSIDEINRDREKFVSEVQIHCEAELQKLGLTLLNTNIQNITDESDVISELGQKAAATAKQQARIDVATQERLGAVGVSQQEKAKRIKVEEDAKGQQIGVRESRLEANVRIEELEAQELIEKNLAREKKSESEAQLAMANARFQQQAEIARKETAAAIAEADSRAQTRAALAKAEQVEAESRASLEALAKAEKAKVLVDAEKTRILAESEAHARFVRASAAARGEAQGLKQKAEGLAAIVKACGGSEEAYKLLLLEKIDKLAETSAKAVSNIKFDKVVIWDSGKADPNNDRGGPVAGFIKDVASAVPPTLDVLKYVAGFEHLLSDQPERAPMGKKQAVPALRSALPKTAKKK